MFDLLLTGGTVVDGTGSEGYPGTVAVSGDTVTILRGKTDGIEAARAIDASGMVICPGFIDLHSHGRADDPRGPQPRSQGPPGRYHRTGRHRRHIARPFQDGRRTQSLHMDGLGAERLSAGGRRLAHGRRAVHPLRPEGGCKHRDNPGQLAGQDMGRRVGRYARLRFADRCHEIRCKGGDGGGCMGSVHRARLSSRGPLPAPESWWRSARWSPRWEAFTTRTRGRALKARGRLAPWQEAIEIGERSGAPVHLTHYRQGYQGDGSHLDYLGLVEDNRARGMDVTFDCYTYPYSGTSLTIQLPMWARQGGPEGIVDALTDPEKRSRIARELGSRSIPGERTESWHELWLTAFNRPENERYDGHSLAEIAELRGQDPVRGDDGPAALGESRDLPGGHRNQCPYAARVRFPSNGDDRQRRHPLWRIPESAELRLLSGGPSRIRQGRAASEASGGHPQDDIVPCPAPWAPRPGYPSQRTQGGHRGLRSAARPGAGYPESTQGVTPSA